MLVLGIDTSLRSTGAAVVRAEGNKLSAVEYLTIKTKPGKLRTECLKNLSEGISALIDRTNPDVAVVEGVFYAKNVKTTMILGEARGAVMSVCAIRNIPVYEYAPRKIKQAVAGNGGASKEQVRKMMMRMLGISEDPQEDEGDALAIAICHLHNRSGIAALAPKEI